MNINQIYRDIESIQDDVDKCIKYSAIINHLEAVKSSIGFESTNIQWIDDINNIVKKETINQIDIIIDDCRKFIKLLVNKK